MATNPGGGVGQQSDEEIALNRQREEDQRNQVQQDQANAGTPDPVVQTTAGPGDAKADPGPQRMIDSADAAAQPQPITQAAPAPADTFKADDIANVVRDTQTPAAAPAAAAPDTSQADLEALMTQRYHSDPNAVNAQLAAAGGQGVAPGNLGPTTPGAPTVDSLLQSKLVEMMGRGVTPSENDPEIKATLDAARAAGQRAETRNQADLAERMAYSGQSGSGAADAARQGLAQNRAATEQQITAATYSDAANRRITELQNTLKLAGDQLDAKAKNALQLQIAQLQDATDRMQIGEGGRQFDTGMAEKIREYGLDYALQQAGMAASGSAASAAAAERAREFDANLGLDTRKQTFAEQSYTQDQNSGGVLGLLQRWAQAAGQ